MRYMKEETREKHLMSILGTILPLTAPEIYGRLQKGTRDRLTITVNRVKIPVVDWVKEEIEWKT